MRFSRFLSGVALAAVISGTAVLSICGAQAASLINNGGFETGDFTDWIIDPSPSYPQGVVLGPSSLVHSGSYAAGIAGYETSPNTLSQIVSTTLGQAYDLSFWRYIANGTPPVSLTVTWNGSTIFTDPSGLFNSYEKFTLSVVGTGSDLLVFTVANNAANTYLDDVSLTATTSSATPLPSTWLMLLSGFVGLGYFAYRGTKKNSVGLAAA